MSTVVEKVKRKSPVRIDPGLQDQKPPFSYEKVLEACMAYFEGDEMAATTWMNKYAMKRPDGRFLERTPADMHKRMAREFARIEAKYHRLRKSAGDKANRSDYG